VNDTRVADTTSRLRLFRFWFALGLMGCGLFLFGCLMHNPPSEPGIPYFDKLEHSGAFLLLGAWFGGILRPRFWSVLLVLSAFGALTEVLQWYSGYRDGDPLDWLADTTGAMVGLTLARLGAMQWLGYIDGRFGTAGNRAR
jgi:VanZ family protein